MATHPSEPKPESTSAITRLPVFDNKRRLWGYDLYCFSVGNRESVGLQVANSAYLGLQYVLNQGKKIMVHHDEKAILEHLPYALPADAAIVKVDERIAANPNAVEMVERLKADAFRVAVGNYTSDPKCAAIYQLADIFCINVRGRRKDELADLVSAAAAYTSAFMAVDLNTSELFKHCRDVGFAYFSGSFFKKPDVVQVRKMSSNEVARFNLLALLESQDPDVDQLVETIESDVSVTFRLLAYLNSAAFGLHQKIKTVKQAVAMLGLDNIRKWLRVVLVTDVGQHKDAMELTLLSAQRGKFMELVVADHDFWGFNPDSLQLLGLFSLLDVMLGIPMEEIVTRLPLDMRLKAALCGDPNSEYRPLLRLARLFEEARWAEADEKMRQLGLDAEKVADAFQRAADWTAELTGMYA